MFKKYPSIENSYHSKSIERWIGFFPELKNEQYIVLEKIHGTNFSIIFEPGQKPCLASRNRLLEPDEDFFGIQDAVFSDAHQGLMNYFEHQANTREAVFQLYGELFGPGINKGVFYGDKRSFLFFDLRRDGFLLVHRDFESFMPPELKQYLVPGLGIFPSLESALMVEVEGVNSLLTPKDYSAPNNLEGVVIKPYTNIFISPVGETFVLKKKALRFQEVNRKKKPPRESREHPLVTELNQKFNQYITEQRLQNVFSREGVIQDKKQIAHFIQLLLEDAKEEFLKHEDHQEKMRVLENDPDIAPNSIKKVFNAGSEPFKLLQPYL